jgi:prepilin-type N-terminal cleavage/methylation domain-containing protein
MVAKRQGFTLVELLVTVTIIGILAAAVTAGLVVARQAARVATTKATIAKINLILAAKWEAYETRRLPMSNTWPLAPGLSEMAQVAYDKMGWIPTDPAAPEKSFDARCYAVVRLAAIRDLVRMEMPERIADIQEAPVFFPIAGAGPDPWGAFVPPGVWVSYRTRYLNSDGTPKSPSQHPSAEMLYMILCNSPEAYREVKFGPSEVGDTDGNGFNEFLDGWGRPIYFLRWAPGFTDSDIQSGDAASDPDPLDGRRAANQQERADPNAFRLMPLVYSAGPDGAYGLWQDFASGSGVYKWNNSTYTAFSDPDLGMNVLVGMPIGTGHFDNIHNHRSDMR